MFESLQVAIATFLKIIENYSYLFLWNRLQRAASGSYKTRITHKKTSGGNPPDVFLVKLLLFHSLGFGNCLLLCGRGARRGKGHTASLPPSAKAALHSLAPPLSHRKRSLQSLVCGGSPVGPGLPRQKNSRHFRDGCFNRKITALP